MKHLSMSPLASRIALLIPPTCLGHRLIDLLPLDSVRADRDVPPEECNTEQEAARILGYTQVSWDNKSGKEKQPDSMEKYWDELADTEKQAATVLGYNANMWDKGKKLPPAMKKHWADLTSSCGDACS